MRSIVVGAVALLLAACTSTSTMRLGHDRAIITTMGGAFTPPDMVQRDLFKRAATMATSSGYEWFVIEGQRDVSQAGALVTPASGSAYVSGNQYGYTGSASYTGGSVTPYVKPGLQVAVRFGNGEAPPGAVNAGEFLSLNP